MTSPARGTPAGVCLLLWAGLACSPAESEAAFDGPAADAPLVVFAVNHPLAYLAERVGGDEVRVELPAPAGVDPAYWRPAPEVVVRFQQADLVLLNGAGYAEWVGSAALPVGRVVDTSASFADRLIETEGAVAHTHGPGGEHSHGETATHTWLDPRLALEQARAILAALESRRPQAADGFRARFADLERDLVALDERLAAAFALDPSRPLLASHPVYPYLARRYDLDLVSLHWEPGEPPSERQWSDLRAALATRPAALMLWEDTPLAETAARLRDLGVEVVVFRPAGNAPADGDFLTAMRANAASLERAYARSE